MANGTDYIIAGQWSQGVTLGHETPKVEWTVGSLQWWGFQFLRQEGLNTLV